MWDWRNHCLIWNDASSSLVYRFVPATGERSTISKGLMVGGIAMNGDQGFVFAGSTGMHLWHDQNNYNTFLNEYEGRSLHFNDIAADSQGRIYAGTLYWDANGMVDFGKLYLIDVDGSAQVVDEGFSIANGIGFSSDDRTLYFADSGTRKIWAYDIDRQHGTLKNKRVFVSVPTTEGLPDGLTVDAEGFVWSAQWYGGQVVRYDPDGKVERRIKMPVLQVSSVAFGGPDYSDLYVTSAAEAWASDLMPASYDPKASNQGGSVYRLKPSVLGCPEHLANIRVPVRTK